MTETPDNLRYTAEHEWVDRVGPTRVRVGITDFAQAQLGDVVFVQLPVIDTDVKAGEGIAEVESTKSVSDIYAPLTAKVVAVNEALDDEPELVNSEPYGAGWIFELEFDAPATADAAVAELLDAAGYQGVIEG
ncbi:glycine cleavage system protein GcvH [Nocardia stercoris]|uniref:Glycine cleavage system H protein n=1 Tax=Nocardia stercoris TaxID=2483361 RepID=A0A3M2L499_9NOCA|nr:glycine cleavage system protein GcvH [Nocardia stercoris]RMI32204.1 glycine cleavage system protein GcvH [Nocardia stercoris]